MRGSSVRTSFSRAMTIAAALVGASWGLYFRFEKKAIWPAAAFSSEPTWRMEVFGSPATRPPRREAISPRVSGPATARGSLRRRLAGLERLDHPVGDVDPRAEVDDVLHDQVELLLLGDLADDAVCLLDHLRQLLVAALVEVLAELALLALEVAVQLAE